MKFNPLRDASVPTHFPSPNQETIMPKLPFLLTLLPLLQVMALEFQGVTITDQATLTKAIQGNYTWDLDYGTAHGEKWKKAELKLCPTMLLTMQGLTATTFIKGEKAGDPDKFVFDKIEGEKVCLHYEPSPVEPGEAPLPPSKVIMAFDGSVMLITTIRDLPAGSRQVREIREYWKIK